MSLINSVTSKFWSFSGNDIHFRHFIIMGNGSCCQWKNMNGLDMDRHLNTIVPLINKKLNSNYLLDIYLG